ncbi:MAG: alpha/beta fold hydrolase [Chloroflexi bacterium AL-W]|nr:alpha/beta fold hydrolase [Chloroflexi bacterium AL-N1]NOK66954.1 alpha/beta fold hydrolase [Chloroflexi bacterium AL-N10]NOK74754.1 alpha/beta fold hydrolase [Chloroflexi bacterium AL-N5]NOK81556.1 alpha/beta fold hydrolase [Chloroflexi bacterium AL-W]NOK89026.1 alpha/beta fold hydrolase [Chloroflexi bacterium AL-N15]
MDQQQHIARQTEQLLRKLAQTTGATAMSLSGVFLGVAAYTTVRINSRSPTDYLSEYTFTPYETQVKGYESVTIRTEDGINLSGWWLPQPSSSRVIVIFGGHRSVKSDMLGIGSGLWRAGNNVLLFDWRSRGQSDIAQFSLAYYELQDAIAAIKYVQERVPDAILGVTGFSMGASIAVLLAAQMPQIRAVVADSPFTGITEVLANSISRYRLPSQMIVPIANLMNYWCYGYQFQAIRPIDAIANITPRPLLLIHGSGDSLIPVTHAHQLFATAGEPKNLWIYPDVEHCGAYFADRQQYVSRVVEFFEQYLDSIE